ncbi:unnamed protein product [Hydatigera taeniaeformis]|uniref:Uncharacterized protein n=1 Tax=Hydatigena taeniaeformis TaxID=6205 RepID=A0A3P7G402_HYDTA|nr:unnamed protein product [Hydatigera taeniaeformis]
MCPHAYVQTQFTAGEFRVRDPTSPWTKTLIQVEIVRELVDLKVNHLSNGVMLMRGDATVSFSTLMKIAPADDYTMVP